MPFTASSSDSPYARGAHSHGGHGSSNAPRTRKTALFVTLGVVFALVAALAVSGVALLNSAKRVLGQAQGLSATASQLQQALADGDAALLQQSTDALKDGVDRIADEVSGPLWSAASLVPVYGNDIAGARALVSVAQDLARNALDSACATLAAHPLSTLMSPSGIDVAALSSYCALIDQLRPVIDRTAEKIDGLQTLHVAKLESTVESVREPLHALDAFLDAYGSLVSQIPELLGCNGSRTYLLIAQANSELRATGGFPGAWGTLTVENGNISLGEFTTLVGERSVTFDLTEEELVLFGEGMAINPGSLNCTPDFPRAASLLATAWQAYMGQEVDGVIAMDPVVLQDVLSVTGGITTSDGTLVDGTNAARILSSEVYWRLGDDNAAEDAFFAEVAGLISEQVLDDMGSIDMSRMLEVISRDADEGRLLLWLRNPDVQACLYGTEVSGALPGDPTEPVLGVYVNDNTWAKIGWYLTMQTQVTGSVKNPDGTVTYTATTTLANTITLEEALAAPEYITGYGPDKRSVDDMYLTALLVAPAGGTITDVTVSSGATPGNATLYGHDVWAVPLNIAAQETVTVDYRVTVATSAVELGVHQTPLAQRS